jgi:hypothetical protein
VTETESHGVERGDLTLRIRCDRCRRGPVLAEIELLPLPYYDITQYVAFYPSWVREQAVLCYVQHLWRKADRPVGREGGHLQNERNSIRTWMKKVDAHYDGQTDHHGHNRNCGCSMHPPELYRMRKPKSVDPFAVQLLEEFTAPRVLAVNNNALTICRCSHEDDLERFSLLDGVKIHAAFSQLSASRSVVLSDVAVSEPNAATDFLYRRRERQLQVGPQIVDGKRTASFAHGDVTPEQ